MSVSKAITENPTVRGGPPGIDVVVPVHGAAEALARCLSSVYRHTRPDRHRLVLVADGPQVEAVEELLRTAEGEARGMVLRPGIRGGFPAAANRGLRASHDRDVVLLNSDSVVSARWLDKLQAAAYSAIEVATATPFSNSATICSLPRWLETNALPGSHDVDSFAALVERVSERRYPRLPTGVGVCLYLKRAALEEIGSFDEAAFGLGYGEESDWCMRATARGWAHVLDDATFVYHEGQASFGGTRAARVRRAHRLMRTRHPVYLRMVTDFLREDPLRPVRDRVLRALTPPRVPRHDGGPERVLHVVHGWPPWNHAGVEMYAAGLARRQARWRAVTAYARIADHRRQSGDAIEYLDSGVRVRLMVNDFTQRNPLARNALRNATIERDFRRLLAEARPQLVHIHHLAGHCATLATLARRWGVAVVYQLQDWFAPCARTNLFRPDRTLCSGPGLGKCSACLPLTRLPPARLLSRLLYGIRGRLLRRCLAQANLLVAGSRFIVDSYRELGWLPPGVAVRVLPYGIEPVCRVKARGPRLVGAPLRLGFVGSLLPHKGLHVAARAIAGLDPDRAVLDVWGDPAADPAYVAEALATAGPALIRLRGRFPEERKSETLGEIDVLLAPSTGLESYGFAAREALALGVAVLASDRGAFCELFSDGGGGALFDPEDPHSLRQWIERLLEDPGLLAQWRSRSVRVKTMDDHAEEIEAVYRELLRGARDRRSGPTPRAPTSRLY